MPAAARAFPCSVSRVVDGDTVDVALDLGFGVSLRRRVRLDGVDAPETFRPRNEAEREHGARATRFVERALLGRACVLTTTGRDDKYGRVLGELRAEGDAHSVNELLAQNGLLKRASYEPGEG